MTAPRRKIDGADIAFLAVVSVISLGVAFWAARQVLEFVALVKWVFG